MKDEKQSEVWLMNKLVPIEHVSFTNSPFELISLVDRGGVLTLQLEDERGCEIELSFDDYIYCNKMDEGDALRTLELVQSESCVGQTLILKKDSELINWVVSESLGVRMAGQLQHYIILALNDVVNVIATSSLRISD